MKKMQDEYVPQFDYDDLPTENNIEKESLKCKKCGKYATFLHCGVCFECQQKDSSEMIQKEVGEENNMSNKSKGNTFLKDITILLSIWGPLLFIIVGGILWKNDTFDGTVMEQLFPAMFFGFIAAFCVVIILSKIFKYSSSSWIIGASITFLSIVICYMLELKSILTASIITIFGAILLIALINWITGKR